MCLSPSEREFSATGGGEAEVAFPFYPDEQDPSLLGGDYSELPDLTIDFSGIEREERQYTGRIDHIIRLRKKVKVQTQGRIQSSTVATLSSFDPSESYQAIPTKFTLDPKAAKAKMSSSLSHAVGGVVGAANERGADGSHTGSASSMAQAQSGSAGANAILHQQFKISDLIHPSLNEPLRNQQQVTFRLVKTGRQSDCIKSLTSEAQIF